MFNFLGSLASLIGLVFSILAFVFAKSASTAAREARDAAMRQSLGADMDGAARTANEINTYLRSEKTDMALLRIGDLMNQTSYLVARWDTRLSKKSKDNLSSARDRLRSMHGILTGNAERGLAPEEKARLARDGQRVSEICDEERGTAAKAWEIRANNGKRKDREVF